MLLNDDAVSQTVFFVLSQYSIYKVFPLLSDGRLQVSLVNLTKSSLPISTFVPTSKSFDRLEERQTPSKILKICVSKGTCELPFCKSQNEGCVSTKYFLYFASFPSASSPGGTNSLRIKKIIL